MGTAYFCSQHFSLAKFCIYVMYSSLLDIVYEMHVVLNMHMHKSQSVFAENSCRHNGYSLSHNKIFT